MESILEIIAIFFEVTVHSLADAVSFIYNYFKKPINFIILLVVLAAASYTAYVAIKKPVTVKEKKQIVDYSYRR